MNLDRGINIGLYSLGLVEFAPDQNNLSQMGGFQHNQLLSILNHSCLLHQLSSKDPELYCQFSLFEPNRLVQNCSGRVSGNPDLCQNTTSAPNPLCIPHNDSITVPFDSPQTLDFPPNACHICTPITVEYRLKSPGFLTFDDYEAAFVSYLSSGLNLTEDQVVIQQYTWQTGPRLYMTILLLPAVNNTFNETEFQRLYKAFSNWLMPDSTVFGPYELISFEPRSLSGTVCNCWNIFPNNSLCNQKLRYMSLLVVLGIFDTKVSHLLSLPNQIDSEILESPPPLSCNLSESFQPAIL